MSYLDIHSHILPAVDDGAKDLEMSVALLEMLKRQGVTHVAATPHFYPDTDSVDDFSERVENAFSELTQKIRGADLPRLYRGCELHYFDGIGRSKALRQFALQKTKYILLELWYGEPVTNAVLQDITDIYENAGLVPILAHVERYSRVKGYKKLLKLVSEGVAMAQINASSVLSKEYGRETERLIKKGLASFIASDTHSPNGRPPLIEQAFAHITARLGKSAATRLKIASNKLLDEIEAANE